MSTLADQRTWNGAPCFITDVGKWQDLAKAACDALGVREFNLGATSEGKGLYRSLGFVEYPAEMRRRVTAAP